MWRSNRLMRMACLLAAAALLAGCVPSPTPTPTLSPPPSPTPSSVGTPLEDLPKPPTSTTCIDFEDVAQGEYPVGSLIAIPIGVTGNVLPPPAPWTPPPDATARIHPGSGTLTTTVLFTGRAPVQFVFPQPVVYIRLEYDEQVGEADGMCLDVNSASCGYLAGQFYLLDKQPIGGARVFVSAPADQTDDGIIVMVRDEQPVIASFTIGGIELQVDNICFAEGG